jgi:hypothetical protein
MWPERTAAADFLPKHLCEVFLQSDFKYTNVSICWPYRIPSSYSSTNLASLIGLNLLDRFLADEGIWLDTSLVSAETFRRGLDLTLILCFHRPSLKVYHRLYLISMWRPFVNAGQQSGTSTSLLWINSGPGGALENSPEPSTIRAHIQHQLRATRNRRLRSLQLDGKNLFLNWAETRCPTEVSECSNPAIGTAFARLRTEGSFLRLNRGTKLTASSAGKADYVTSDTSSEQLAYVLADPRHNSEEWITWDVDEAVAMLDPRIEIEPFFCVQIGGLRQDPFSMLPIESTGMVPYAFDYCKFYHAETEAHDNSLCCLPLVATEYAPVAARTGGFHADLLPLWIGELMQDAMAFEAYLALALSVKRLGVDTDSGVSKAILKHSTNGMSALRRRLLSGTAAISDMVILTIMALAAVQVHFSLLTELDSAEFYCSI